MSTVSGSTSADISSGDVRVRASLPREPRRSTLSAAISFAIHAAIILILIRVGYQKVVERGNVASQLEQQDGGGGGGGTGGVAFVSLPPPPPPPPPPDPEVRPPEVVPVVVPRVAAPPVKEQTPPPVRPDSAPSGAAPGTAGTGGGSGGGAGVGTGTGQGSGTGSGSGGGEGGGAGGTGRHGTPPEARQLILPPIDDVPKSLRGKTVQVTFTIDVSGAVQSVSVTPPITDRKFSRKFDESMRKYRFRPARDADGVVVVGVTTVTVTF